MHYKKKKTLSISHLEIVHCERQKRIGTSRIAGRDSNIRQDTDTAMRYSEQWSPEISDRFCFFYPPVSPIFVHMRDLSLTLNRNPKHRDPYLTGWWWYYAKHPASAVSLQSMRVVRWNPASKRLHAQTISRMHSLLISRGIRGAHTGQPKARSFQSRRAKIHHRHAKPAQE